MGVYHATFGAFHRTAELVVLFCAFMEAFWADNASSLGSIGHEGRLCGLVRHRSGQNGDDLIPRLGRDSSALKEDMLPQIVDVGDGNSSNQTMNFDKSLREAKNRLDRQPV